MLRVTSYWWPRTGWCKIATGEKLASQETCKTAFMVWRESISTDKLKARIWGLLQGYDGKEHALGAFVRSGAGHLAQVALEHKVEN